MNPLQGGTGIATGGSSIGLANPTNTQPIYLSAPPQGSGIQLQGPNQTTATGIGGTGGTTAYGGGGGTGGAPAIDPQTAAIQAANAQTVAQLQSQMANLDPQQQIGLQNILNSYNLGSNRLDQQNAAAQRDYGTRTDQNLQNYQNTRNNVITNTQAQSSALQRLLGINGAGNSSAAYEAAPYAAALAGSQLLNGAQQTFGNNGINLDTAWQDTERNYGNSMQDLQNQRYQQENALKSSIAQTKATLLDRIAQANNSPTMYNADINTLLGQITQLGNQYANPVLRTSDLSYSAPSLADYVLNKTGSQLGAPATNVPAGQSDINPALAPILGGQRDEFGNIIPAVA